MKINSNEVTVDELLFNGIFIKKADESMLMVTQRPDFIMHPLTKTRVDIKEILVSYKDFTCPHCQGVGKHGIILLKSDEFIICCVECRQFVFCNRYFEGENGFKLLKETNS